MNAVIFTSAGAAFAITLLFTIRTALLGEPDYSYIHSMIWVAGIAWGVFLINETTKDIIERPFRSKRRLQ